MFSNKVTSLRQESHEEEAEEEAEVDEDAAEHHEVAVAKLRGLAWTRLVSCVRTSTP